VYCPSSPLHALFIHISVLHPLFAISIRIPYSYSPLRRAQLSGITGRTAAPALCDHT
jgi:hypothetical protein